MAFWMGQRNERKSLLNNSRRWILRVLCDPRQTPRKEVGNRKLDGQRKKLRAFSQPNARRNKHVKRQPFNETQSANHIVNHNNVNLTDLQKQISDLKEIVCSHVLKTLQINRINTITVCSLTLWRLATKPARVSPKTNGTKTKETPLEKGGQPKKGN